MDVNFREGHYSTHHTHLGTSVVFPTASSDRCLTEGSPLGSGVCSGGLLPVCAWGVTLYFTPMMLGEQDAIRILACKLPHPWVMQSLYWLVSIPASSSQMLSCSLSVPDALLSTYL